ncbi:MAG: hypothetical protein M3P00_08400, partial [Gemmatimonadota bacterium]|nr:hypothetical protein [Gemmatimonadota bacterium]
QITEGKTSPATDIFAVGGVLYQILTLMKPFDAPTLQNLFFKIITEKPRPVSELMPGLPPALDRIVNKAMAKEPSDRYANALQMANDLTEVRSKLSGPSYPASVSLSASVASAIEQSRQSSRIRTRKLAFAGGGTLAAAAVIAIAWSQLPKSGSAKAEPANPPAQVANAAPAQTQPTITPAATTSTNAPVTQPAPTAQPVVKKEKPPVTSRDVRTTNVAKTSSKPVQTRVASPPPIVLPAPSGATRQENAPVVSPPPPVVTAQPAVSPPKQETTAAAPAVPTAAEIGPAVEAFARAIESRDIGTMRREYPGLRSEQLRGFEVFFSRARTINATLRVTSVEGSGASAVAHLEGVYAYVTGEGVSDRQPVSFTVLLRPEGKGWHLVSMR